MTRLTRLGRNAARALLCCWALAQAGCVTLENPHRLEPSYALAPAQDGALHTHGQTIAQRLEQGESAFWLLDRNDAALRARLALTDEAVATLDVQYFIWQADATGRLLSQRLMEAADRGVRVRLLLDDLAVGGRDGDIAGLNHHPRIEVRVFNPWNRRSPRISQAVEFLFRLDTLNHRMHNKIYVADNQFGIVGGRNISDRYFGVDDGFVQNDLDVLVYGPLVEEISASFDAYWNSGSVYPGAAFAGGRDGAEHFSAKRQRLETTLARNVATLMPFGLEPMHWDSYLEALADGFVSGPASLFYDSPYIEDGYPEELYEDFRRFVLSAEEEVLISTPYFIPALEFLDEMEELVGRGVRVAVLTNSLASNNQTIAHTGYRQRRRPALRAGLELYELRSDAPSRRYYATGAAEAPRVGLHTKAVVIDGRRSFLGSPNIDPRSMRWNTEIGFVVESEALAARLTDLIARDMAPENAWRVALSDDGWLSWSSGDETLMRQPARGFGQRVVEFFLNLLPVKGHL